MGEPEWDGGDERRREEVVPVFQPGLQHARPGCFLPKVDQKEVDQQESQLVEEQHSYRRRLEEVAEEQDGSHDR